MTEQFAEEFFGRHSDPALREKNPSGFKARPKRDSSPARQAQELTLLVIFRNSGGNQERTKSGG